MEKNTVQQTHEKSHADVLLIPVTQFFLKIPILMTFLVSSFAITSFRIRVHASAKRSP